MKIGKVTQSPFLATPREHPREVGGHRPSRDKKFKKLLNQAAMTRVKEIPRYPPRSK